MRGTAREAGSRDERRSSPTSSECCPQARSASILVSSAASRSSSSARRRICRERLGREIGERRSAPERERAPKGLRRRLGRAVELATAALDERAEALEVELLGRDLEGVAGRSRDEHGVRLESLAKSRNVLLKRGLRVRGRALAPELVDEAIARDGLAAVEKEDREDASLSRPAEREPPLAVV